MNPYLFIDTFNLNNFKWWENSEKVATLKKCGIISNKSFEKLSSFFPTLDHIYPERWDIQLQYIGQEFIENFGGTTLFVPIDFPYAPKIIPFICIHFPSVIVENEAGRKHKITDLIVHIPFFYNSRTELFEVKRLYLQRFSYLRSEFSSSYSFSHAVGFNIKKTGRQNLQACCLGISDMKKVLMLFSADNHPKKLALLLYSLPVYFSWESKEGGAYQYFTELFEAQPADTDYSQSVVLPFVSFILEDLKTTKNAFDLNTCCFGFSIIADRRFEIYLAKKMEEFEERTFIAQDYTFFDYERQDGSLYAFLPRVPNISATGYVIFRGKGIPLSFSLSFEEETSLNSADQYTKILKPGLTNAVVRELNKHFEKKRIKNYINERYRDTYPHYRRGDGSY